LSPREERDYNWALETLRKEGKLGGVFNRRKRRTALVKDTNFKRAKEAARAIMSAMVTKDIDRVMCDPDLRRQFDEASKKIAPGIDSYLVRKAALNYRKKGKQQAELSTRQKSR
jgi:hypothetical protein